MYVAYLGADLNSKDLLCFNHRINSMYSRVWNSSKLVKNYINKY